MLCIIAAVGLKRRQEEMETVRRNEQRAMAETAQATPLGQTSP